MVTIEFLKELIKENEMSCKEIANKSRVSARYLYYLLEGRYKDISINRAQQILSALNKEIVIKEKANETNPKKSRKTENTPYR